MSLGALMTAEPIVDALTAQDLQLVGLQFIEACFEQFESQQQAYRHFIGIVERAADLAQKRKART